MSWSDYCMMDDVPLALTMCPPRLVLGLVVASQAIFNLVAFRLSLSDRTIAGSG